MAAMSEEPEIGVEIHRATLEDAEEILALQYLAYEVEAILYDDWLIPPLVETVHEVPHDIAQTVVLKVCSGGRIVGSVRGRLRPDSSCYVGRLIVHPDRRRRGIATRMMLELEACFPGVACFELFTGEKSAGNIKLYEGLGYREMGRQVQSSTITIIILRKPASVP